MMVEIDHEIARLQQARDLLSGTTIKRKPGRPAGPASKSHATSFDPGEFAKAPKKRRTMSAEGRARIAEAQRARWTQSKTAAKKLERAAASATPKKATKTVASRKKKTAVKAVVAKAPTRPKNAPAA
jgi:hypothetical protein